VLEACREARSKLIVKQKFCASNWLITEINSLVMFVNNDGCMDFPKA